MSHGSVIKLLNPDFFVPQQKGYGPLLFDPSDPINAELLHFWDFRDGAGSDLRDLAANNTTTQKNANHLWSTSPYGDGLLVGDTYECSNGPTVNLGTGDYTFVFNCVVTALQGTWVYISEVGDYNPGMRVKPVSTIYYPAIGRSGSSHEYTDLPVSVGYNCFIFTRLNGVVYGYLNGKKSATTWTNSTNVNAQYTINGGYASDRLDRVILTERVFARAIDGHEALQFYEDLNSGLKPANDAPFLFSAAVGGNISQIPVGEIALTGQAPQAVTTEKHISEIPAGSITLTGQAPQIVSTEGAANTSELPAGNIAFTGQTPSTVTTEKHIAELPAGSITLTGQVPSVSDGEGEVSQVPAGSIAFTGQAPQVVTTEKHIAEIPAGSITLTGQAPQVVVPNTVQVPAGTITLTGRAPSVNDGATPAVPYDIAYTGGGRVMREGVLPKWWEQWEEPQPKEIEEERSTDEQIAELIEGLMPETAPRRRIPRRRIQPTKTKISLVGHPPEVISTRRRAPAQRTQRKMLAATLLASLLKRP